MWANVNERLNWLKNYNNGKVGDGFLDAKSEPKSDAKTKTKIRFHNQENREWRWLGHRAIFAESCGNIQRDEMK